MINKKGQVTIFIVVGVIIMLIAVLFFSLQGRNAETSLSYIKQSEESEIGVSPIKSFAQQCIEKTLEDGFLMLGYQGGLTDITLPSHYMNLFNTSYLYYNGAILIPTYNLIEDDLTKYLRDNLNNCTNNFKSFPDYEVSGSIENLELIYLDDEILYDITYPLEIKNNEAITEISDFEGSIDLRFSYIYETLENIIYSSILVAPYLVDFTYLQSRNLNVSIFSDTDNAIIYVITDPESTIQNKPYQFIFAAKIEPDYNISLEDVSMVMRDGRVYADMTG